MPRIREYAGYGGTPDSRDKDSRERVYRMPEVSPEEPEEKENAEAKPEETEITPQESVAEAEPLAEQKKVAAEAFLNPVPVSVEKMVFAEKDLNPKYSRVQDAIDSIIKSGEYYEDYSRGTKTELLKSKEFVLTAISQNYRRFYAPETPKPADWLDEEYLAERAAYFFEMTKENVKPEVNADFAAELYSYLRKSAFSSEAYAAAGEALKRAAKVGAAKVTSVEEGERMRSSLARLNAAVNSVMNLVKEKHAAAVAAEAAKSEKLAAEKKELAGLIDEMKFEF